MQCLTRWRYLQDGDGLTVNTCMCMVRSILLLGVSGGVETGVWITNGNTKTFQVARTWRNKTLLTQQLHLPRSKRNPNKLQYRLAFSSKFNSICLQRENKITTRQNKFVFAALKMGEYFSKHWSSCFLLFCSHALCCGGVSESFNTKLYLSE